MAGLRVALVVSPWYPVPPDGYGGIELMTYLLASELQARGHEVTVIGRVGSEGPFEAVGIAPESWTSQLGSRDHEAREALFLYRAHELVKRRAFDVIHEHSGFMGMLLAGSNGLNTPVVATLHGDLTEAAGEFLAAIDSRVHLVAISRAQQAQVAGVNWRGVVHNAVQVDRLELGTEPGDYLVQMARIVEGKGQHLAIQVAREAGLRLVLAGKVDAGSEEYFESEIRPHLGDRVEWRENVKGADKARLLAGARAMLFPLQWEEPFGLAMVEAMASGTPVVALARGAAPELVEPGVTGFLAQDAAEMVDAVRRLDEIDRTRCAERARSRFAPAAMAAGYESVYDAALKEAFYRAERP